VIRRNVSLRLQGKNIKSLARFYQGTRQQIPEENYFPNHHCENLKSHNYLKQQKMYLFNLARLD
jgi:hypothetical protein